MGWHLNKHLLNEYALVSVISYKWNLHQRKLQTKLLKGILEVKLNHVDYHKNIPHLKTEVNGANFGRV